jgi:mono/diheme cytochrome c family protein
MGQTYARSFAGSGAFAAGGVVVGALPPESAGVRARRHEPAAVSMSRTGRSRSVRTGYHFIAACGLILATSVVADAHDPSSMPITWNREISRLVYDRCASCHRPGGTAFSLMTYQDAQPRADTIKASVVSRRMPPWGAVKGFGAFRNDIGLTQEQIALFADWVEGGVSRGNNPNALPNPPALERAPVFQAPPDAMTVAGDVTLDRAMTLDGLMPVHVPDGAQMQIVAVRPDGAVEPLLWLYEYKDSYRHPFLFRKPVELPAGARIQGLQAGTTIQLLPARTSWFWSLPLLRSWFGGSK